MKLAITRLLLKMAGLAPLLCCFTSAQQSASTSAPSVTSIVQGMERSQSEVRAQGPYQVIREYRLFGANSSSTNADVVAQVDFKPPTGQNYNIQKWSGSGRGKQVVQRVLDHEAESRGNQARTALTSDNYDFTLIRETVLDGRPCYLIGLNPKRKEKDLVLGTAMGGQALTVDSPHRGGNRKIAILVVKKRSSQAFVWRSVGDLAANEHGSRR